jgi:predicted nucleic acid-binding protein
MNAVFADTSYYVALLLKTDSRHERAVDFTTTFSGRVITTEWVLSELGNYLSPVHLRNLFVAFLGDLKLDPEIIIISATSSKFDTGAKLYAERLDKAWSLVDCISFLTMREHGIADAVMTDHHFEQAGFKAVLT